MIQHGKAPFLECSSRGDRRFSAFYARVFILGHGFKYIEAHYQEAKVFEDGSTGLSWRESKGRKAVNQEALARFYSLLWDTYIAERPALQRVLVSASGLSDMFGQPGHVCQASELWRIRNELLNQQPKG